MEKSINAHMWSIAFVLFFFIWPHTSIDLAISDRGIKELPVIGHEFLSIQVFGTGETAGHVMTWKVTNNTSQYLAVEEQTLYVPSAGGYQDYIVSIPEGVVVPPHSTADVPGMGYCGSARKPAVSGEIASVADWLEIEDPFGPFITDLPVTKRADTDTSFVGPPVIEGSIRLVEASVLLFHKFAEAHPGMEHMSGVPVGGTFFIADGGAHKVDRASKINDPTIPPPYRLTFPGSELVINGYYSEDLPDSIYAPILLEVVRNLEQTIPPIQESGLFPTPFSIDPVKEMTAMIQQVLWIYTSGFFGNDYTKDEFTERTFQEAERTIGIPITDLPEEQQASLQGGVDLFWANYTATGMAAKLIDPKTDLTKTGISEEGEDYLYNLVIRKKEQCKCDSMTYTLLVEESGIPIIQATLNADSNPRVYITKITYGVSYYVQLGDIKFHCSCGSATCQFYPLQKEKDDEEKGKRVLPVQPDEQATDDKSDPFDHTRPGEVDIIIQDDGPSNIRATGNHNCTMKNDHWVDEDRDEFGFTIIPKDEGSSNAAIFQRLQIVSYCKLEDCLPTRCSEFITISLVSLN